MLASKGVAFCISFTISKCWIHCLERAVVLLMGKRAGAEAPLDLYPCTSLVICSFLSSQTSPVI